MKYLISNILFYTGDLIARTFLRFDCTARFLYPVYHKIMTLSNDIHTWGDDIDNDSSTI